ncbi:hypothetical protein ACFQE1_02440 [Halobium palmae]|uniref:Glycine zipper 2TM domain-containing protein n=1 Tax=Halobium palmae TaxID=1776492 RepID=A0ABD5RV40_9EURY
MSFFASLVTGYWLSGRDDGEEHLKKNIISSFVGMVGTVVGYELGKNSRESRGSC